MAKPNKASISYSTGKNEETGESITNTLRFHTVIAEQHQTTAEVTKFPVASQKYVSNHSIRKNRKVTITGMVSNHVIVGQGEMHEYGQANAQIIFAEFKRLIQEGVPCVVNTNLGIYDPVIFTNFQTKQEAGMTDAMKFVMTGEEIILGTTINSTTPAVLVFTPLSEEAKQARIDELLAAGIHVSTSAELSEAVFDPNKSFVLQTRADNGNTIDVTYERTGYDPTTKLYSHAIHTSDTKTVNGASTDDSWSLIGSIQSALPNVNLPGGAEIMCACAVEGAVGLATRYVEGAVDTALGSLKQSVYGAVYKVKGVNGDRTFGQELIGLGLDCFVVGAVGATSGSISTESFDTSLPTADDVLNGAAAKGNETLTGVVGVASPSTITKITPPYDPITFFGGAN